MILQTITGVEWVFGLGVMFALALFFNAITYKKLGTFISFLLIFNGFIVWGGLLPVWTLILMVIIFLLNIFMTNQRGK